ncbi:MAG: CHAT domain-containing protein [Cyanobium sp.]
MPAEVQEWFEAAGKAYANGDPAEALRLQLQVMEWVQARLGPLHPIRARVLNNLSAFLAAVGRRQEALAPTEEAVKMYRELGKTNPAYLGDLARALDNLADLKQSQAAPEAALQLRQEMVSVEVSDLQRQLPLLPEQRRQAFVETYGLRWQIPFSSAQSGPSGAQVALFTRLNRHALLLDLQRNQALLARSSAQQPRLEQLQSLVNRLSSVTLNPQERQDLVAQQEKLEQELYRQLPALRPQLVQIEQVRQALPAGSALVEFQRYWDYDPRRPLDQRFAAERYLALILKPNGQVHAIPLGEAAAMDAAIANAFDATEKNKSDALMLWAKLSQLVLTPLQPQLTGVKELFLSPDGELNRVPFAALSAPGGGKQLLAEAFQLRLLTSGRDLLRLQQPARPGGAPVVMADPQYGMAMAVAVAPPAAGRSPDTLPASGRPAQLRASALTAATPWMPLPGSREEARQVAALLPGSRAILGAEATAALAMQQRAPRIFHLATHGFFVAEQSPLPPSLQAFREAARSSSFSPGSAGSAYAQQQSDADPFPLATREDPLLRSGLVLAGANNPQANPADDGYLTAAEILAMELEGTELVTLSACETGLGDQRTGEGVFGLQRALAVAGARSSLLSLWEVDDAATAAFMTSFYQRLRRGDGRAEALAATQAEFRTHQKESYRDPFVWAAFQLSGDWRPIPGMASR